MINEIEIPIQIEHPEIRSVKIISNTGLVNAWVNSFSLLKEAIEEQRKLTKGNGSIMYLLGDHVITYIELPKNERMVYFLPFNLSPSAFRTLFNSVDFFPLYEKFVEMATTDLNYTRSSLKFVTLKGK